MVRGGSFNNNDRHVRAAYRNRNRPDNRNTNIGFRVVVSTLFDRRPSGRNCLAGSRAFQAEAKNGGVCSRPCPDRRRAGRIATAPHPGDAWCGATLFR